MPLPSLRNRPNNKRLSKNTKLNKPQRKLREKPPKRSKRRRKLLRLWPPKRRLRESERRKLPLELLPKPRRPPPKLKECKLRWTDALLLPLNNKRKHMKLKKN